MGLGDKLKDLRKQAQEAVTEHKDQIEDAMGVAAAAVDKKTHGKHTAKIAKFGQKATAAVDKFGEEAEPAAEKEGEPDAAEATGVASEHAGGAAPGGPEAA